MSKRETRKKQYAFSKFNTCKFAGAFTSIEVDKENNRTYVRGFCEHHDKKIDIYFLCRICLSHRRKEKKTKMTATRIARIKKGRSRNRKLESARQSTHDKFVRQDD